MPKITRIETHDVRPVGEIIAEVEYVTGAHTMKTVLSVKYADGRELTPDVEAFAREYVWSAPNRLHP